MRFKFHSWLLWLGLSLLAFGSSPLFSAETTTPPALGQLLGSGAHLDGTNVPSGATLFSGSQVSTQSSPAAIHLSSGQIVELGSNSAALFERAASGEVQVRVLAGTARFRAEDGNLRTAGPEDSVWFSQRRAGRPIYENQEGVVGVLAQSAREGQRQLVVEDASKIEPTGELVVRSRDRQFQELKCSIEHIRDQIVTADRDLKFTFQPEDLLVQRLPVSEHRIYGVLTSRADDGDDELRVNDAKQINPLEQIEIRHPTRPVRELACVRFTRGYLGGVATSAGAMDQTGPTGREETIKLFRGLRNEYPVDAEIRQGVRSETEAIRTSLSQPAEAGRNVLFVAEPDSIDPMLQVMIRSADGSRFEAYCLAAVENDRVILAEDLDFDYAPGSEVLQGRSARALIEQGVMLQRVANCCCCCDGAAILPFAWWWFVPPGAAAATAIGIAATGDELAIDCDLFPTPTAPPECRVP